jgi:hypothetical protein
MVDKVRAKLNQGELTQETRDELEQALSRLEEDASKL